MPRRRKTCLARIENLAKSPVSQLLIDAKVFLLGDREGPAWATNLMLATGARIALFAKGLSARMRAPSAAQLGVFGMGTGGWTPVDFDDARLAAIDAHGDLEAAAFVQASHRSSVLFNVIDRPEFNQFRFRSIAMCPPAIISFSTHRTAPTLGQALRRRVETQLHAISVDTIQGVETPPRSTCQSVAA